MSNNLERNIAVVFAAAEPSISDRGIAASLKEFQATPVLVSVREIAAVDTTMFDGLVLNEVSTADPKIAGLFDKLIKKFHRESKPIGVIGRSVILIVTAFGASGVEVTAGHDEEESADLVKALQQTGAQYTACPATDYISDRDHKVITTPGSFLNGPGDPQPETITGIRRMLREVVEMA